MPRPDDLGGAGPLGRGPLGRGQLGRGPLDLGPLARAARRSLNGEHPGEVGIALPPLCDHHVHLGLADAGAVRAGGIAAVLDLGWDPAVIARLAATVDVPRIAFAGALLAAPGGYPLGRWGPPTAVHEVAEHGHGHGHGDRLGQGHGDRRAHGPGDGRVHGHDAAGTPADHAVREQAAFGASVIKITLNSDAGPVFGDDVLADVVGAARAAGLPVVAHVEGEDMARRAIEAGIDALAHTPWTERLDDALIAEAVDRGQRWISTLDIHGWGAGGADHDRAVDNLRRFHAAGGVVLYGTDLGNGDLPAGVNPREVAGLVASGLDPAAILSAMTAAWPGGRSRSREAVDAREASVTVDRRDAPAARDPRERHERHEVHEGHEGHDAPEASVAPASPDRRDAPGARGSFDARDDTHDPFDALEALATFVAGPPPAAIEDLGAWLATARILPAEELEPIDR
ncbi:hypothetical protein GE115_05310 [Agromyces sp. CFH 90414]|uniref:Amidohydrolase-related domain-containing protein n=1 Tax=Agromyces agglutinans TaxID=2662258 RepID=A0A6I2F9A3_9MICO|nr:hypothetical protein [Agromyces agglutinans]MRG59290.1 hypothetical protein [Agromyces agglutinans]